MKSFTMNQDTMNHPTSQSMRDLHAVHELGRDEAGRLYSIRMREMFAPLGLDMSAVEALAALKVASHSLGMLMERWAEQHGLSQGRMGVLFRLMRCGDTPLGDLAEDLGSTPRHITGLVGHLERDGLVEPVPDPDDRRSVRARLTEAGRGQIGAIWQPGIDHPFERVAAITLADLAQLLHRCV